MGDEHRLQLDPTLRPSLFSDGALPPVPDYQLTPPSLLGDKGPAYPSVMPGHLTPPGQGPAAVPSLDPTKMLPLHGHYAEQDADRELSRRIMAPVPGRPGGGGSMEPPGLTLGDWRITGRPAMSTDERYDTPGTRARAEQQDRDQRDAQRRGETVPDPVGDLVRGGR